MFSSRLRVAALVLACGAACARPEPPFLPSAQQHDGAACRHAVSAYLPARAALDFCERDADCVEIVPEPCLSSYYANIATAGRSLAPLERDLSAQCGVPASICAREPLGRPSCREGHCRRGGRPPRPIGLSCWWERWQNVTLDRPHVLHAATSPVELAIENASLTVEAPGRLTIRVDWGDCSVDRALQVNGLGPGPIDRRRAGNLEIVTASVSPGDYTFRLRPAAVSCPRATMTAHLERDDGAAVTGRFHGLSYRPACED